MSMVLVQFSQKDVLPYVCNKRSVDDTAVAYHGTLLNGIKELQTNKESIVCLRKTGK